jgi:hypothetical protein
MTGSKIPLSIRQKERRSGLNRRWIKTSYRGDERRSGHDRRSEPSPANLPVPKNNDPKKIESFEKLLLSGPVQLEAIIRLLLEKGIIEEEELFEMIKKVQRERKYER